MLPAFTDDGLLPPGIHRASFPEFERRFVYFAHSDRRFRIFDGLRELYLQASRSPIVKRFLVGGSFVTSKPEPNDFDCILVLDRAIYRHNLRPAEYNLVSRRMARRIFGGDVIPAIEGSIDYQRYLELFQLTRGQRPVGIVEVEL